MVLDGVEHLIKDILDISARFPLLFFYGLPEVSASIPYLWLQWEGGRRIQTKQQGKYRVHTGTVMSHHHNIL